MILCFAASTSFASLNLPVLAHDPEVTELNMSIFTAPAQSNTLTGSTPEVGEAIITQYKKSPTIDKAILESCIPIWNIIWVL
ncbi:hypothetical protein M758_UG204200 [Ceratodon purpureus]|nr:hypothetical protein M758_UG204200 [Ceratodon purpureus]